MMHHLWTTKLILAIGFLVADSAVVWSQDAVQTRAAARADASNTGRSDVLIDVASVERRLKATYERVNPAIVEIFYGPHSRCRSCRRWLGGVSEVGDDRSAGSLRDCNSSTDPHRILLHVFDNSLH
jgi:hypothetical protein